MTKFKEKNPVIYNFPVNKTNHAGDEMMKTKELASTVPQYSYEVLGDVKNVDIE